MSYGGNQTPRYIAGDWYVICDRTGNKIRASEAKREWNGLLVHYSVWEPRHPQDFVRGTRDVQSPPFTRGEASDTFVDAGEVKRIDTLGNWRVTAEGDFRRVAD